MERGISNFALVAEALSSFGWDILEEPKPNDTYYDLTAVSNKKSLRVEIKRVYVKPSGSWEAQPISKNQHKNDLVAIILPNNRVMFEEIDHYLSKCSPNGSRFFTFLKP